MDSRVKNGASVREIVNTGLAFFFLSFLLVGFLAGAARNSMPQSSSFGHEARFSDASPSNLAIVPASCPSDPHYAGECTEAPSCIEGYVLVDGMCVPASCPSGYVLVNGSCVPTPQCPTGYVLVNGECVLITVCPIGFQLVGGTCLSGGGSSLCPNGTPPVNGSCSPSGGPVCPSGYRLVGTSCVTDTENPPSCTPQYVCSGPNLMNTCTNSVVASCSYGCWSPACEGSVGPIASPPAIQIVARPAIVVRGNPSSVVWTVSNVASCTVRGTNGDTWSSEGDGTFTQPTRSLAAEANYVLTCLGVDESLASRSVRILIAPTTNEQ
jgi:hypothetical protein